MSYLTRRMISGKVLIHLPESPKPDINGLVVAESATAKSHDVRVFQSGQAPEGEPQIEDGQIIKVTNGGSKVNIDGVEMLLINYSQILYIY